MTVRGWLLGVRSVFIDVDLTLVDASSNLRVGVVDALQEMVDYGYELYAWSHGGYTRANAIITQWGLEHYFRAWMGKPDMIIDDSPPEELVSARRVNYLDAGKSGFWSRIWPEIFHKEVTFAEDKIKDDLGHRSGDSQYGVGADPDKQLAIWDNNHEPTGPDTATTIRYPFVSLEPLWVPEHRCCGRFCGEVGSEDGVADRGDIVVLPDGGSTTSVSKKVGP